MSRLLKRQRGFTLIELLIVIAIIGIIAAILIPNFLDSLQKAKQKRSMGDMKDVGTAWFAWLTDQFGAAAAAGAGAGTGYTLPAKYEIENLEQDLLPRPTDNPPFGGYIQEIPATDAWQNPWVYCRDADPVRAIRVMAIVSKGRDGDGYGCTEEVAPTGAFEPTDYDQDLIWADGFFIRYPQKTTEDGGATP